MARYLIPLGVVLLLLAGCAFYSPLYFKKDIVHKPGLQGTWECKFDSTSGKVGKLTIAPCDEDGYSLTSVWGEREELYYLVFLELDGKLFADLQPCDFDIESNSCKTRRTVHVFMRVQQYADSFTYSVFGTKHFERAAENGNMTLLDNEVYSSATDRDARGKIVQHQNTEQLQYMLLKYYDVDSFWSDPVVALRDE